MADIKIKPETCSNCFATLSIGQANCTANIFGAPVCVKCASGYSKFDSVFLKKKRREILAPKSLEIIY
ncbi:MAG TPA: hypothetical protein VD908_07925 [Cytophagales bacterium]|nr:hypothetical protein [Cytophagales bacterium]